MKPMLLGLFGLVLSLCCACSQKTSANHPSSASSKTSGNVFAQERASTTTKATDQSNDKTDLTLVQEVRRALMENDTLSVAGKNVTAVAHAGTVTLKGEVTSEDEKDEVEACVSKVAGVQRVENQITVKPS